MHMDYPRGKEYHQEGKELLGIESDCNTCWKYGLWAIGDAVPMGPMDASDGFPTQECPECGANPNPLGEHNAD
jgi:hypothetical protein